MELPPQEFLLEPWLTRQSLGMVYAWRGVGKTWFSLAVAYAVASGGKFLGWKAPKARRVLYLDGEMPAGVTQERLASIVAMAPAEAPADNFQLLTPDLNNGALPDLATVAGRTQIDAVICECAPDLVVLDNLSAWIRTGERENDAESWSPMTPWLLKLRAQGRAAFFVHQAGKGGQQRGTSKKEDLLDVVIALRRPPDYQPENGAHFEVAFEKARALAGAAVDPVEAPLVKDEAGALQWTVKAQTVSTYDRVVELAKLRLTQTEIAEELNVNKSSVCRAWNKAVEQGDIKPKES